MKKGFTMIELIFVIVILGILAAVAIPRLAATRDDATVSKAATDVATAISDMTAFYTATGAFSTASNMTNVVMDAPDNNLTSVGGFSYELPENNNCVTFSSTDVNTSRDGQLIVTNVVASRNEPNCASLQDALSASDTNQTYTIGGRRVTY